MESSPLQTGLIIVIDNYPVNKSSRTYGHLFSTHLLLKNPGTSGKLEEKAGKETGAWEKKWTGIGL